MSELVLSFLEVSAGGRAQAVERWWAAQPDAGTAARALAEALAAAERVPYTRPGPGATTALIAFLDAEKLRFALDEAATAASDPEIAAQLWTHAANSSLIVGELADLPHCYARQAILTGSQAEAVWSAYQDSLVGYSTGFFEDIEELRRRAASGELPEATVTRAIAAADRCAEDWDDDDRERLELMR